MSNVVTSRGWFNIGRVAVNTEPCSARTRLTMSFITKPITIIIRFNIIISKTFDIIISGLFSWHILYPLVGGSQAVWAELRSSFPAHTCHCWLRGWRWETQTLVPGVRGCQTVSPAWPCLVFRPNMSYPEQPVAVRVRTSYHLLSRVQRWSCYN